MKGFELYNGNQDFRIVNDARTVMTTEGMLINLLPPAYDISLTFSVAFPDFTKDYLYSYNHLFDYNLSMIAYDSSCATQLTIPAQAFADEVNLMAAPASSDIFVGSIIMSQTAAPSSTWNGSAISPLQPMGKEVSFVSGSLLMEAKFGMARAFSIYVSGGQLKLHRNQSVSTPPGGFDAIGTFYGNSYSFSGTTLDGGGGGNYYGSQPGIPVLNVDLQNVLPVILADIPGVQPRDMRCYPGGSNACAIPNPASYNYGSSYQVILSGAFGRRS